MKIAGNSTRFTSSRCAKERENDQIEEKKFKKREENKVHLLFEFS